MMKHVKLFEQFLNEASAPLESLGDLKKAFGKYKLEVDRNTDSLYKGYKHFYILIRHVDLDEDIVDTTLVLSLNDESQPPVILTGTDRIKKFLDKGLPELVDAQDGASMDKVLNSYDFEQAD